MLTDEQRKANKRRCNARYVETHRDELRVKRRQHYVDNPEKQLLANRLWQAKNPEAYKQVIKRWKRQHPESSSTTAKRQRQLDPRRYWLNRIKARSKMRGVVFSLRLEDIVFPETCPVLDIPMNYEDQYSDGYPHLDRVQPSLGYVSGNVQMISARANRIKQNGTSNEHRLIAEYIERHEALAKGHTPLMLSVYEEGMGVNG